MRLGPGLLYEGRTLQGARPKLADFCSATMAEFYSAVDKHYEHIPPKGQVAGSNPAGVARSSLVLLLWTGTCQLAGGGAVFFFERADETGRLGVAGAPGDV
ncbi:hypothetical protein TM5383_01629 [Thalassovita mediterranea]|uniref:Uncharacterized protein n=1 Tax=Thalassovita mediterranea TaxID=340021 RepID=A0A0N7M1W2_9RHOB|nr:hypothetical protein TM5383_01629 [Thalassovita mediterranea]SIS34195.1 hypothetical protein SAMN05421685_1101 [Thalassovita mediterranea]